MTFPALSIAGMIFSVVISLGLPIALLILVRKKKKGAFLAAGIGAAGFVVFTMLLEPLLHNVVLGNVPAIKNNAALLVLYVCLTVGVFEETARLLGLIIVKRWHEKRKLPFSSGLMFGVGHGGAESIFAVGLTALTNLMVAINLNTQGLGALTAGMTEEQVAGATEQLSAMVSAPSSAYFLMGVERITAIFFHIALSVLIWMVVTKRLHWIWYPAAILLHAVGNVPVRLYAGGILTSLWLVDLLTALVTGAIIVLVWLLYRDCKRKRALAKQKRLEEEQTGEREKPRDGEGEPSSPMKDKAFLDGEL